MEDKKEIFESYYSDSGTISNIKWFEPFVQPEIIEEYNKLVIQKGMRLLDVGCGCSLDSIFFAAKGLKVSALDFSSSALDKLKKLTSIYGLDIETINVSVLSIPKEYNKLFDVVLDNGCFHHLPPEERIAYAKAIKNVLVSGGYLYIRCFSNYELPPSDCKLGANRVSSDEIISTFFQDYIFEELRIFEYILTSRGRQKMWFVKLRLR